MIKIISLTKDDFYHKNIPSIFHDVEYAHHYYCVSCDEVVVFKFSMQSEIKPTVIKLGNIIIIGFDQVVAFFCLTNNELIKSVELSSFFYNFEFDEKYLFIVCEVEVIVFMKETLDEYKCIDFVEYIDHVELGQEKISVYLIDGSIEDISI
ncbi:hypothetical protein L2C91_00965 [Rosenbergiella epipactidis]|uniref:hypothetical protein n=1 Tax=Rosenbergiella epipactidis TaxID=1544694 RepID=UPI002026AA50|nr:hypothetical protein [Rosenbergiella epipactidis]MCL9666968.1 hypothetical protein [Rosenbergiella epipactidis]